MNRLELKGFLTLASLYLLVTAPELGIACVILVLAWWIIDIIINILNAKRRREGKCHLFSENNRQKIISDDNKIILNMKNNNTKVYKEDVVIENEEEELSEEMALEYKKELDSLEDTIVNEIKKIDINFNFILFLKLAHDIAKELIKTKIIKFYSAKYVYTAFNKKVIEIKCPDFFSFEKEKNYYVLKMRVEEKKC